MPTATAGIGDTPELIAAIQAPQRLLAMELLDPCALRSDPTLAELTKMARSVVRSGFACVTLVEAERVIILATDGWEEPPEEKSLTDALCAHTAALARPITVPDARRDPVFRRLSAVQAFGVVAYLGVPILDTPTLALGTVCAFERVVRHWRDDEVGRLSEIATRVREHLRRSPDDSSQASS